MAKAKSKPKLPLPAEGGSSIRNPKTGVLTPNEAEAAQAQPPESQENNDAR